MNEEIKQSPTLTDDEFQTLFCWGEDIFGDLAHALTWRPKDLHFVLYRDGKPVTHVGLLQHVITVNRQQVSVAGVGGVVSIPEVQRLGLAQRLMRHATDFFSREWIVSAGLLFCLPKLEHYYARLGWQTIAGPVTFAQPSGQTISPMLVMVLPLQGFKWPEGAVDLQSLPW